MQGTPHNLGVEQALLGALIFDNREIVMVSDKLSSESFFGEQHQIVWEALVTLNADGSVADANTLIEFFHREDLLKKIGGEQYLAKMVNNAALEPEIPQYAEILIDLQNRRALISMAQEIEASSVKPVIGQTPGDIAVKASETLSAIMMGSTVNPPTKVIPGIKEYIKRIRDGKKEETKPFLSTGSAILDRRLGGGFFPSDLIILAGRPSMGKCLKGDTLIRMHDGSLERVDNIKVGDFLMGDDSTPRTVTSLASGLEEMVWVHQTNAESYCVNASHILSLQNATGEKGKIEDIPLSQARHFSPSQLKKLKGYRVAIDLPDKMLAIEPYMLGVWLGDGTASTSEINNPDREIIQYLEGFSERNGFRLSHHKMPITKCPRFRICGQTNQPFSSFLKDENLLNNKHIPNTYLTSGTSQRWQLLAGLIDTDGCKDPKQNTYEIVQKSTRLADDIKNLAEGLGLRVRKTIKKAKCQTGAGGDYVRLRISGDLMKCPILIKRKQPTPWNEKRNYRLSTLSFESAGKGKYFGFTLDGNRRFVLADGTVTHNTMKALNMIEGVASNQSLKKPGSRAHVAFFSLEMDTDKVLGRLMTTNSHKRFGKRYSSLKMRSYDIPDDHLDALEHHAKEIGENIHIDDDGGVTVRDIEIRALNLIRTHGYLDMIVVDYLQIINAPPEDRAQGKQTIITNISAGLKRLAKKLDIPVIALSQLSRQVESRDDKRPQLSDLRDSGSIEQDADVVMFAYRSHYYVERSEPEKKNDEKHTQWNVELERTRHQFQLIIGKQRIGPVGSDTFWCDTLTGYVGDCDPHDLHGTSVFS